MRGALKRMRALRDKEQALGFSEKDALSYAGYSSYLEDVEHAAKTDINRQAVKIRNPLKDI